MALAPWEAARSKARAYRASFDVSLSIDTLIETAIAGEGLTLRARAARDPLLYGALAVLDTEADTIWIRSELSAEERRVIIAHELGHLKLHHAPSDCRCDDGDLDELPESAALGYGPKQRRETEANVFAREFLLPSIQAQTHFTESRRDAYQIAGDLGLPVNIVFGQLALSAPAPEKVSPETSFAEAVPTSATLDDSQRTAAEAEYGPLLVGAGPGTGKTRTLTARVLHLVRERGVRPENILALTFSRKAAEEMRERIAAESEEIAARAAITTFHAFGLDFLRRRYQEAGLPAKPILLSEAEAFALLERRIAALDLDALHYLHDPSFPLPDVLRAISKRKESGELPESLYALAEAQQEEKWRDVARIWTVYETLLQERGAIDFADLVVRPLRLLEARPDLLVAERTKWRQILVDEYQDINRSGARLVQLLSGADGAALWAVGDLRQAIYAFRGASPANVVQFAEDFPLGRRADLAVNYRSQPDLVKLFGIACGEGPEVWRAQRTGEATATLALAEDDVAQADGLARWMKRYIKAGYSWSEMAVLCRTRNQLRQLASALVARNIPVLAPDDGGLLARPDVQRLLAVVALSVRADDPARAVLSELPRALKLDPLMDGFAVLQEALWGPARLADTVSDREAVAELISLAQTFRERAPAFLDTQDDLRNEFLVHLRRLSRLGGLAVPPPATVENAVHLLTVHGSKGLEFPIVFVPNLAAGRFPPRPMPGLLSPLKESEPSLGDDALTDEEARLFFVALTRARDHLVLSRAAKYGRMPAKPSPLLDCLYGAEGLAEMFWKRQTPATEPDVVSEPAAPITVSSGDADLYLCCPKRYAFANVDELPRGKFDSYTAFQRAIHAALNAENPRATFDRIWAETGPDTTDPAQTLYQRAANTILNRTVPKSNDSERKVLEVPLPHGTITVRADATEADGFELRTLRKPPSDDFLETVDPEPRHSLLQEVSGENGVYVRYLQNGERFRVASKPRTRKKHLDDYDRALRGIALKVFPATPADSSDCPNCPYFFICPRR